MFRWFAYMNKKNIISITGGTSITITIMDDKITTMLFAKMLVSKGKRSEII